MDRIPPVLNRGVISNWLEAKPSVSSMLTVNTLGDIGFQDIPVAEWGSIGGDLANQSDLSAYLTSLSEGLTALDTVKYDKSGGAISGNVSITPIWNSVGSSFTALSIGATNTASTGSLLSKFSVDGKPYFATDISGNLLLGSLVAESLQGLTHAYSGGILVAHDGDADLRLIEYKNSSTGPTLKFGKSSRSFSLTSGATGLLGNGWEMGKIEFSAWNGSNGFATGARIYATTQGGWTAGTSYPTVMYFQTTPSGSTTAATVLTLDASGTAILSATGSLTSATQTVDFRYGSNAQRIQLYGNYTDNLNYRRLFISSTNDGAFTLGVEGAGTGASGNTLNIKRDTFGSYAPYLIFLNESGYSEVELQQGLLAGYGGTLTLRAGDANNTGFLRFRYDAGYPKIATTASTFEIGTSLNFLRLGGSYIDLGSTSTWMYFDTQNFDKYFGTNPQTMRIFNTRTSATNFETYQLQWLSNEARIGTAVGSAGGTQQNMVLGGWNAAGTWVPAITIRPTDSAYPVKFNGTTGIWVGDQTTYENSRIWSSQIGYGIGNVTIGYGTGSLNCTGWNSHLLQLGGGFDNTTNVYTAFDSDNNDPTSAYYIMAGCPISGNPATNGLVKVQKNGNVGIGTMAPIVKLAVAGTIAAVNGTNATSLEVYGTYTDASNYRRLYISSTTTGAFTLGVEGLGTGASGNTLTLTTGSASLRVNTNVQASLSGSYTLELSSSFDIAAHGETKLTLGSSAAALSFRNTSFSAIDGNFNLGGSTSSHVGIRRSGTTLQARLGDNSDFADFAARAGTFSGTGTFNAVNLTGDKLSIQQVASPFIVAIRASTSGSAEPILTGYPWHFAWVDDVPKITMQTANTTTGVRVSSDSFFAFTNTTNSRQGTVDLAAYRDAANTWGFRNGANAQRFNLYGTYTDASNYRRLYISSTTAGAFTLGVEGLGTGASGNTLAVNATTVTTSPGFANSQAFGPGHSMVGTHCTLIGTSVNQSYSNATIGIGCNVNAVGRNSVYIGNSNTAPTPGSIVGNVVSIGDQVNTQGSQCVAIGGLSYATNNSIVIGYAASDSSYGGVTIGHSASATGTQPVAIGDHATSGSRGVAIGRYSSCYGQGIAIGDGATTTANGQLHFGGAVSPISIVSFPGATFNRINLGEALSSNPAIKRNGTNIQARLADDSGWAGFQAGDVWLSGTTLGLASGCILGWSARTQVRSTADGNLYIHASAAGTQGVYLSLGTSTLNILDNVGNLGATVTAGAGIFSGTLAARNGTNATRFELYGTYTDASNYRRLYLSSTTAGEFTLGTEGLGTGATGNSLVITSGNNLIEQRNSTNAQAIRIFNTYTSTTNFENYQQAWVSNEFRMGSHVPGSGGTGSNRNVIFGIWDTVGTWKPLLTIAANSGVPSLTITPQHPTGLTYTAATISSSITAASTEATEVNFNLSSTKSWPTGPITTQRAFRIQAPTYSFVGVSTITTAATLAVSGAPIAGTNATITDSWALSVESGPSFFGGKITAPATGQASTGGIGNGGNGIDFFQGVIVYNTSSVTAPYPAYFCDGQSTSKLKLHVNTELQWDAGDPTSTRNNGDLRVARDTSNTWAQRNGANAQTWRLYGTYTDASNYRRLYLTSTTAGAFTLGVEGLGTGLSGNTLTVANNLGIGSVPDTILTVSSSTNALGYGNGVKVTWADDNSVNRPVVGFYRARGSITALTNISSGDVLGSFSFYGRFSGNFAAYATIRSTYESGSGGNIEFWTSPSSNGNDEVMRLVINRNGLFGLGGLTSSFPSFKRNGTAINFRLADDSADAPITASTLTVSDRVWLSTSANLWLRGTGSGIVLSYYNSEIFRFGYGQFVIDVSGQGTLTFGSQTNISCVNGGLTYVQAGATSQVWRVANTYTDQSNFRALSLQWSSYSSVNHARLSVVSAGTGIANCPLVLTPGGTGAFIVGPMPDGTATGGNARGTYAVDLQLIRNSATQVASGAYSFVAGQRNTASTQHAVAFGFGCTASGGNEGNLAGGYESVASGSQSSLAWGNRCTASGPESSWVIGYESSATSNASIAQGHNARSDRPYQFSHAAGRFSTAGDAQYTRFVIKNRTTDATPVTLLGGVLPGSGTRLTINDGEILGFVANITGSKSDGSAVAHYVRKGMIKRVGTTTTLVYVETVGTDYEDNAATDVSITADDTNDALQIQVTGIASETWRWVATVEAVDLGFGT